MLVSVIMSVYNSIAFLQEAIDSMLEQTHTDFEFIILDDGSTEPVFDLIKSCLDTRIIPLRNTKNIGLTKSLNICLDKVHNATNFVVRNDSDDLCSPDRIEKQLKYFEKDVGFVTCWNGVLFKEHHKWQMRESGYRCRISDEDLIYKYTIKNCGNDAGTVYSIAAVRKIGYFDERLYLGQTYNYNRRIQRFFRGRVVQEILYLRRDWPDRIGRRARRENPKFLNVNWSDLCNQYANEKLIISERERHPWED